MATGIAISVANRRATITSGQTVVSYASDITCTFTFDAEWAGKTKTARFYRLNHDCYTDVVLVNDACLMPLCQCRSGIVSIGVFAGNLITTSPANISVETSILDKFGLPVDPAPTLYTQLVGQIDALKTVGTTVNLGTEWIAATSETTPSNAYCAFYQVIEAEGVTAANTVSVSILSNATSTQRATAMAAGIFAYAQDTDSLVFCVTAGRGAPVVSIPVTVVIYG